MLNWATRIPARAPVWAVALVITLIVAMVSFSAPFIVSWVWPGVDPTVLMVGNLFFGMILGSAGVLGFLTWRWEVRR